MTLFLALTAAAYLAAFLANWAQMQAMTRVGQQLLRVMRGDMFRHIQRLPLTYFDRVPSGVVVSRVINDVQTVNELLGNGIIQALSDVLTLVLTVAVMVALAPKLALVTFAVMPLMVIAVWIFTERAKVAYRHTRITIATLTGKFAESYAGVRVVQAFAREAPSRERFDEINNANRVANVKANTLSSLLLPVAMTATVAAALHSSTMVGHTGAGKTTVASLLARFYDPVAGAVLLDGHDLRDLSFETLRRNVGLVLQDNFLFSGTIADNIRYGRAAASDDEVVAAARVANAHDFIGRLPLGYQTPVQERAANLSLGQRQLIAIARTVLADPRVLILDEATSNIDSQTELLVQQALHELLAGRTSLVIAHRLSTIRAADQVLVLDAGRIVERGRHDQLRRSRGPYSALYQQQFAELVLA